MTGDVAKTGDKAIQSGAPVPIDSRVMATFVCDKCGREFRLIHIFQFADAKRAHTQAAEFKQGQLHGEHCDEKFVAHLESYEL